MLLILVCYREANILQSVNEWIQFCHFEICMDKENYKVLGKNFICHGQRWLRFGGPILGFSYRTLVTGITLIQNYNLVFPVKNGNFFWGSWSTLNKRL